LKGDWKTTEWVNLGGDKSWPAPEGDWSRFTGRKGWRPPPAFDGLPAEARIDGGDVVMISPVDPYYGIRVTRRVQLDPTAPVMRIATSYERVSGPPAKVGVWVITQLRDPESVFAVVPPDTKFTNGYAAISKDPPPSLHRDRANEKLQLLSLARNPKSPHKIGSDGGTLVWVGREFALRIDAPRVPGSEYPDQGSSTEVYTNPDPLPYVELETLGPLHEMKVGDRISATNTYTLLRRERDTARGEALRVLKE
jgi:hypothetical protein